MKDYTGELVLVGLLIVLTVIAQPLLTACMETITTAMTTSLKTMFTWEERAKK